MPKKSFKDNPALQFLTVTRDNAPDPAAGYAADAPASWDAEHTQYADNTDQTYNAQYTDHAPNTEHVRHTDTAAAPGLADAARVPEASPPASAAERKTRRLNLLIRPSLLADIGKIAHMNRVSVNELINAALEQYRDAHADKARAYEEIFGE